MFLIRFAGLLELKVRVALGAFFLVSGRCCLFFVRPLHVLQLWILFRVGCAFRLGVVDRFNFMIGSGLRSVCFVVSPKWFYYCAMFIKRSGCNVVCRDGNVTIVN